MFFGRLAAVVLSIVALLSLFGLVLSGRTQQPLHALLVFGREGKIAIKVQLRGKAVWVDTNSNGLFERSEKFADQEDIKDIELHDPDGVTTYVIKGIGFWKETASSLPSLDANVRIQGVANYRQYCDTAMKLTNQPPAMAHFHGPLSIGPMTINWQVSPRLALRTGDKPTELGALIGTMNMAKNCWTVIRVHDHEDRWLLPEGTFPAVDIEFPAKIPGDPPIKRRYPLEGFC